MRITFKKQPRETGLAGVGFPYQSVDIKMDGRVVGYIGAPNWQTEDNKWDVHFMVYKNPEKTKVDNCAWRWMHLIVRFENEVLAREWVIHHFETINKEHLIRCEED